MKKKLCALLSALLLAASLTACGETAGGSSAAAPPPVGAAVELQTVEVGDIATESTVTGSVNANRTIPVLSPVACKIKSVQVKSGETVKKGAVLFTLDTADLRDTYGTLLTTYTSTKALLDEQLRQATESVTNLQALYEMGAVSKLNLDQASLSLMQVKNTRESTLAQLGLDDVMDALDDPNVYAPIAGTLSSISVTAGVMMSNTAVAATVSEIGRPQVVVSVSESLQPSIGVGDKVSVAITSFGGEPIEGIVASVASAVSQNSALYEVHIDLPETLSVSMGMFARVTFRTDERFGTVLVPTEAILTDSETQYVFIVDSGVSYRVDITTGLVGETQTEVTTGLSGGEQLVTRGQSYLSDGATVDVAEE